MILNSKTLWFKTGPFIALLILSGCFGGVIRDAETNKGINRVRVRIKNCNDCDTQSVKTKTYKGIKGWFQWDTQIGPGARAILPVSPAEAVQIVTRRRGYRESVTYHTPRYQSSNLAGKPRITAFKEIALYRNTSLDTDLDGLTDAQERALGTDPTKADTDGDSLPDGWEVNGHDYVDLPNLGADPLRKDIFVEVDYMTNLKPKDAAIISAIAAFANAPVDNPDGSTGITLHVEIDDVVPTDHDLNPVWTEFDALKETYFSPHRAAVFHYCVIGENYDGGGSSGTSRGIEASDFVVTLGPNGGSEGQQTGTFLHELGHNLGLRHGGLDNVHYKPNYLSVMNYSYQLKGLRKDGVNGHYDYSRFELEPLDESAANELEGLNPVSGISEGMLAAYNVKVCNTDGCSWNTNAASRVDFNQDNNIDSALEADLIWNQAHAEEVCPDLCSQYGYSWTGDWWSTPRDSTSMCGRSHTVESDTNKDGIIDVLRTHNDWANLVFDGGGAIGASLDEGVGAAAATARSNKIPALRRRSTAKPRVSLPGDDEPCPPMIE